MKLPGDFLLRMEKLLGADEFQEFIASFDKAPSRGIRLNMLKTEGAFESLPLKTTENLPWCDYGVVNTEDFRPGKSVLYNAGAIYVQEPSAMCPAEVLLVEPGMNVLDLCAAPGGKSTQLAGRMKGEGLLISNDKSPSRSRALVKNLELAGVTNAVVLTEHPGKIAERFPLFFDRILVDAPCSGEGMFRRDPDSVKAYTANKPEACAKLQYDILRHAAVMLKHGGRMVYSTCTFNNIENEGVIGAFLEKHKDFELVPIDHRKLGLEPGRGDSGFSNHDLSRAARIWPHKTTGEGHFIALLERNAGEQALLPLLTDTKLPTKNTYAPPSDFVEFCANFLKIAFSPTEIIQNGTKIYAQKHPLNLSGLRTARSGWYLGECMKNRFVPSQPLAMGLKKEQAVYSIDLPHQETERYLRGETLEYSGNGLDGQIKPWILVCHETLPLGWARLVQGRLKNQLPVGWVV